jgi:tetratricopeptide (TPR) repeat protein
VKRLPSLLLVSALMLAGCGDARGPYASNGERVRDVVRAEAAHRQAIDLLLDDPAGAERMLREVLGFDLYHGPAHNNLGVLLLNQGRLYDAAEEFEWARKLLPGNPEPRVNLAITLQRGGKYRDALDAARTALEVRPGNLPAVQIVAQIQVREGLADASTLDHLDTIVLRSGDPRWRDWAERQRLALAPKLPSPPPAKQP